MTYFVVSNNFDGPADPTEMKIPAATLHHEIPLGLASLPMCAEPQPPALTLSGSMRSPLTGQHTAVRPHAGCWTSECAASIAVPKQTRGPFCGPSTLRGQHGVLVLAAGCSARAHQPALQRFCQLSIYLSCAVSLARAGGVFGTSGANPVTVTISQ